MKTTTLLILKNPSLESPTLVEGLPGMGHVGKLAAEHLVNELKAKKFAEIYSPYFPHQVTIGRDGVMRPLRNELYYASKDEKDFIIWIGDVQPLTPEGHYQVVERVLDASWNLGARNIFTLGGFATGKYEEKKPQVLVLGDKELIQKARSHGALFEPTGGPIIGAAGLLVALGKLRGMKGLCLLGETPGMMVDPRAAKAVLEILLPLLGIDVDLKNLEQRAKLTQEMVKRLRKEMERRILREKRREEEEVSYIG